jgi:hypothetical protein
MSDNAPSMVLLHCEVDTGYISDFRLLINGKSVKYVTIDSGLYDIDDICFAAGWFRKANATAYYGGGEAGLTKNIFKFPKFNHRKIMISISS